MTTSSRPESPPRLGSLFRKAVRLALALAGCAAARAQVNVGDAFPALSLTKTDSVPDIAGKIVLVDFWASWCAPCKASFPAYARIHDDYAPRGLVIVAVSVDDDPAAYAAFAKRHPVPFPLLRDVGKDLVRAVRPPTMPTSYLVGPDGKVRFIHRGFHSDSTERTLRTEIDKLLAEK